MHGKGKTGQNPGHGVRDVGDVEFFLQLFVDVMTDSKLF